MMLSNIKIGIIVADVEEYKPLAELIEKGEFKSYNFLGRKGHSFFVETKSGKAHVISILCGIGKVNATAAAMHLVDIGCNYIMNFGLSGGISGISRGEVMLCNRFMEHDFDLTGIGYKPCEKPAQEYIYNVSAEIQNLVISILGDIKVGMALSGDRFICNAADRDFFKENFGAMSCDMETAAIAYVAENAGIPFISLRRISDDAGDDAVNTYTEMNNISDATLTDCIFDIIKSL